MEVINLFTKMITVAICTYNRSKLAIQAIESVLCQNIHNVKVLIVDQSKENYLELQSYAAANHFQYFRLKTPGLTNARNFAADKVKTEYIFYLDDDAICGPTTLSSHIEELQKDEIVATSGPIYEMGIMPKMHKTFQLTGKISISGKHLQNRDGSYYQYVDTLFGGNMAFKTRELIAVGGFDVNFKGLATWEETDVSFRLRKNSGKKLSFNPKAYINHYPQQAGNIASKSKADMQYYYYYTRNATVSFLRGRPLWQQPFFIIRHLAVCEKKALLGLKRPGLGVWTFLKGYVEGCREANRSITSIEYIGETF